MVLLGKKNSKFTSKTGELVEGVKLFIGEGIPLDRGAGYEVDSYFIRLDSPLIPNINSLSYGDDIIVIYDKYGKIQDIYHRKET